MEQENNERFFGLLLSVTSSCGAQVRAYPEKYLIIIFLLRHKGGRVVRSAYLLDFGDFAGERTIGNVDDGANLDGLGKSSVGAGNASVVTFDGVVGDDLKCLSCNELNWLVVDEGTSADLGALGVEHDRASLVGALLKSLSQVCDGLSVRLAKRSDVSMS